MAAITSAASGNWSATGTWTGGVVPGEGDTVTIQNGHTVTINQNITVGADTSTPAIQMSGTGKLVLPSSPAADYTLTCKGDLNCNGGGFEIASSGSPLDSARKFTIKLNYSATLSANEYRMNGSLLKFYGRPYAVSYRTTLTAQAASGQAVINVGDATGWAVGDEIIVATSNTTKSQTEAHTIQSIAGNQVTLTANLAYTHESGAPVVHLTRNILITNYNDSYGTNVNTGGSGVSGQNVLYQWVRFKKLKGNSGHWSYNGAISTYYGSNSGAMLLGCVFDGGTPRAAESGNEPQWDIQKTVVYNHGAGLSLAGPTITNTNIKDNVILNCTSGSGILVGTGDNGRTWEQNLLCSGNWVVACGAGSGDRGIKAGGAAYGYTELHDNWIYAQTGDGFEVASCETITRFSGCVIWGCSVYGIRLDRSWCRHFDNNALGDPTANSSADIRLTGRAAAFLIGAWCKLNSTTKVSIDSAIATALQEHYAVQITHLGQVADRHASQFRYGVVADHVTGGQAANWARGGAGLALLLNPSSQTNGLRWECYVPVTAATAFTLSAYVRKTSAAANPTLTCTIYDTDEVTKLLDAQSVTLTENWAQYTATQVTPSQTGFCRVVFEAKDGATTGDIGVDDVEVA